jgi:hypothetical protein
MHITFIYSYSEELGYGLTDRSTLVSISKWAGQVYGAKLGLMASANQITCLQQMDQPRSEVCFLRREAGLLRFDL